MEYKIETIADFQKVPDDRLVDCLNEVVAVILDSRMRIEFPGMTLESIVWIDDGIHDYQGATLKIGDHEEYIPNPNFKGPREP